MNAYKSHGLMISSVILNNDEDRDNAQKAQSHFAECSFCNSTLREPDTTHQNIRGVTWDSVSSYYDSTFIDTLHWDKGITAQTIIVTGISGKDSSQNNSHFKPNDLISIFLTILLMGIFIKILIAGYHDRKNRHSK